MRLHLGLVLASIGSAATAQTTTTDCTAWSSNNVRCTTNQQNGVNWGALNNAPNPAKSFMDSYQQGVRMRQEAEQANAARAQRGAAEAQAKSAAAAVLADELHREQSLEAAKMVTAGDCEGAKKYALSSGNFVLAKQVKDYCG